MVEQVAEPQRNPYRTIFHHDGTVTVWDVYTQSWFRTDTPSDRLLATLSPDERKRVQRHTSQV